MFIIPLKDYSRFLDDEFDAKAWVNNAFRTNRESSNDVRMMCLHCVFIVDYKHLDFSLMFV